ncbi:MAG TPA: fimbria/pilus outer membrane usher protein [Allosphingosinicella sp.]|jgi:outer membrane usher protein|nr:fimbria/pilus outer membrane usher protein [Allosphingosinicella sp.]
MDTARRTRATALLILAAVSSAPAGLRAAMPIRPASDDASKPSAGGDVDDAVLDGLQKNQILELAVVVNGAPTGRIGEFVLRGGILLARRDELEGLGLRLPRAPDESGLVALDGIAGFAARIDPASQTIYLIVSSRYLAPTIVGRGAAADDHALVSGTGAVLNYDIVGTSANGGGSASGLFDARFFSPLGVLSSGLLAEAPFGNARPAGHSSAIRLDTTYVYSDPRSLRRYRLGDFISGGLPWTRPVRLGGAQVDSDFSMRPDLVTFPVPAISGSAAVPSTVDVLVNGARTLSTAVPPGPFQVPQVPVVTGGGTVTTTVTDALGRQVVTELPFYASEALLAPGLQTYSAEIGFVRRNWGVLSNNYGAAAGALTYRRGLSSHVTIEAHAEATDRLAMAGIGAVVNLADFALLNLAAAGSSFQGRTGGQISAGVERITPRYSLGGSVIAASKTFGDIAAADGDPVLTLRLNAFASVSLRTFGSLGIAYTEVKREAGRFGYLPAASPALAILVPAEHSQILTASYSRQIGRVHFYASGFRDFAQKGGTSFLAGITIPLGRRTSATVGAQAESGRLSGQIEASRNVIAPGDWGFRVYASGAGPASAQSLFSGPVADHEFGEIIYKAQWAELLAGVDRFGGHASVQGEVRGAIATADGGVFAANRIDDSFAIVDTAGAGGIRVRYENRDVGRTDSRGRLLVPELRSFEANHVSIEPLDAPPDADVAIVSRIARPQDRSGIVLRFPVTASRGALLRLVDANGAPIAPGSIATLGSTGAAVPVGYDGEAYVVGLQDRNTLEVELPDGGRCTIAFDYQAGDREIPRLGPFTCREIRP